MKASRGFWAGAGVFVLAMASSDCTGRAPACEQDRDCVAGAYCHLPAKQCFFRIGAPDADAGADVEGGDGGSDGGAGGDGGHEQVWPLCSASGWCWESPQPQGTSLYGLWAPSADEAWTVGGAGTVLRRRGSIYDLIPWHDRTTFFGVWGSSSDDVWIVGDEGTIARWNGTNLVPFPSPTTAVLFGVWGSSPLDIWAVGTGGAVLHFNGTEWSTASSGTSEDLYDVWGNAHDQVWAVGGSGTIIRFDGSDWASVPSPTNQRIRRVAGTSASNVWAAGDGGAILRFDGKQWALHTSAAGTVFALAVNESSVWAFAGANVSRWNGSVWTTTAAPSSHRLIAARTHAGGGLIAVGHSGEIVVWDGAQWTSQRGTFTTGLRAIWAAGPNDLWLGGTELHRCGAGACTRVPTTALGPVVAIAGKNAQDVWAVDADGRYAWWTNATVLEGEFSISGVSGFWMSNSTQWAATDLGLQHAPIRGTFSPISQTKGVVNAWAHGDKLWVVTSAGTLEKCTAGGACDAVDLGSVNTLTDVTGLDEDHIFVSINSGSIIEWNGSSATTHGTAVMSIRALHMTSAASGWAIGPEGEILRWDGSSWLETVSPAGDNLIRITGTSNAEAWVLGSDDVLLRLRP
jgi:hypothetical protein